MQHPLLNASLNKLKAEAWRFVLAAIVIGATGLALYWVFLVPIYMAPDEPQHLDYALNIYSAGRLVNAREPLNAWNTAPWDIHVYTQYLHGVTHDSSIAYWPENKFPADYGTKHFYEEVDRNAPAEDSGGMASQRRLHLGYIAAYPCGYYALLAAWLKLVSLFSKKLTVLFFAGRILSTILLACSLLLVYGVSRELHFTRPRSLALTFIVGFFPMTTFVASYIQPDNLGLTLALLCWYLALLARRRIEAAWPIPLLGVCLGLLCVTKYHFFLVVFLAVVPMLIVDKLARGRKTGWVRLFVMVLGPSLLLAGVQMWVSWGYNDVTRANVSLNHGDLTHAASQGVGALVLFLLNGIPGAFSNFYFNGNPYYNTTFATFWGDFGWEDTLLIIWSPLVNDIIRCLIVFLNFFAFPFTIVRIGKVIKRLLIVGRKRGPIKALTIAFSNPALNSYFAFTFLMFCLFVLVRFAFAPQGRNWFPFMLPIFLVGTYYAPKIFPSRRRRVFVSNLILALLVAYCVAGSYYAIGCLHTRFYGP
jgi:hypothetical protein